MNDQHIIENTHFEETEEGLRCFTLLPGGDEFSQIVSSPEAVQKNMVGWCNTVREYLKLKEVQDEEERIARKRRIVTGKQQHH